MILVFASIESWFQYLLKIVQAPNPDVLIRGSDDDILNHLDCIEVDTVRFGEWKSVKIDGRNKTRVCSFENNKK